LAAGVEADDDAGAVAAGVRALEVLPLLPAAAGAVPALLAGAGVLAEVPVAAVAAFDLLERLVFAGGAASAEAGATADPEVAAGVEEESAAAVFLDFRLGAVLAAALSVAAGAESLAAAVESAAAFLDLRLDVVLAAVLSVAAPAVPPAVASASALDLRLDLVGLVSAALSAGGTLWSPDALAAFFERDFLAGVAELSVWAAVELSVVASPAAFFFFFLVVVLESVWLGSLVDWAWTVNVVTPKNIIAISNAQ
jgi:hypothetical protein